MINFKFIQFNDLSTDYTFYNSTTSYPSNTLKFNLRVDGWPFNSINNKLDVEMENELTNDNGVNTCEAVTESGEDEGHLLWWRISMNGVSVYLLLL